MSNDWQPIGTAPKNDERIIVAGGTWIRGNRQQLPRRFPAWWCGRDGMAHLRQRGPRALIRGPKVPDSQALADTMFR